MHIAVCIKQTPASTNVPVDPATGNLKTDGLQYGINPFDEYAIEEALRIKEKLAGSDVSIISEGPNRTEEAIRSAIALGADEGYLLSDPAFDRSDPAATAYLLSLGIKKLAQAKGSINLVLCGKQTNDGESGQVGAALGAWLEWPAVAFVKKVIEINDQKIVVERVLEDGTDTLELSLPAVISVIKEINEPRLPSLKGKMAAKKAAISKWGQTDLSPNTALVGSSSGSAIIKTASPPARGGGILVPGNAPEEKAAFLVQKLKELKLI